MHLPGAQVHVTVDTAMQSGDLTIAAFVARTLALGERALAKEFQAVPCSVRTVEIEKLGGAGLGTRRGFFWGKG